MVPFFQKLLDQTGKTEEGLSKEKKGAGYRLGQILAVESALMVPGRMKISRLIVTATGRKVVFP